MGIFDFFRKKKPEDVFRKKIRKAFDQSVKDCRHRCSGDSLMDGLLVQAAIGNLYNELKNSPGIQAIAMISDFVPEIIIDEELQLALKHYLGIEPQTSSDYPIDDYEMSDNDRGIVNDSEVIADTQENINNNVETFVISDDKKTLLNFVGKEREIIIPEGIEVIAEQAFCGCQIFSVAFPSTLRRIEDNAFCSCASLSKADISKCNNLDHIGDWAFSWCLNLKGSFVLPMNLKTIGANPFAHTSIDSIVSLSPKFQTQDGVLLNKDDNRLIVAFFINEKDSKSIGTVMGETIYGNKNFKVYNIPSYVRIIGDGSFIDAEIEQININSNVEIIGDNPAPNGTKTSFKVENNFRFCIENDMLIDKINGVVLAYFGNNKDLIIPDGVKSFAGASFDMADIDTLIFPETIEEFDEDIFERMDSCPKEIRVPKGTLMKFKSVLPSYNHLLKEIV